MDGRSVEDVTMRDITISGNNKTASKTNNNLGDIIDSSQPQSQTQPVKKKSGFVITSVTDSNFQGRPPSVLRDGEESADDLDESHASYSDISYSRTTDVDHDQESTASEDTLNISAQDSSAAYPVPYDSVQNKNHALQAQVNAGYNNTNSQKESENIQMQQKQISKSERPTIQNTLTQDSIQDLPHDNHMHLKQKIEDVKPSMALTQAVGGVQKSAASRNLAKVKQAGQTLAAKTDRPTALAASSSRVYKIVKREPLLPAKRSRGRWTCIDYSDAKTPMVGLVTQSDGKTTFGDSGNGLQHSESSSSMSGQNYVQHSSSSSSVNWEMVSKNKRRSIEKNHILALGPEVLNNAIMVNYQNSSQNADNEGSSLSSNFSLKHLEPIRPGRIDNKIEAVMDLVKKHLMAAVRDEVDELKEKIKKLNEEITVMRDVLSEEQMNAVQQALQRQEKQSGLPRTQSQSQGNRGQGGVISPPTSQQNNNNLHSLISPTSNQIHHQNPAPQVNSIQPDVPMNHQPTHGTNHIAAGAGLSVIPENDAAKVHQQPPHDTRDTIRKGVS